MTETTTTLAAGDAERLLARARLLCEPQLREAVDTLPDPLRLMARYHLGFCDSTGAPAQAGWGKGLRSALAFAAATACGADPVVAVPAAVSVELMHNFTLVHDDVMDGDRTRRGRDTVWRVWGIPMAICLGDALHALAIQVLTSGLSGTAAACSITRMESTALEVCRGQCDDTMFETRATVSVDEYLTMATGKTGALMGCACALGGWSAEADTATAAALDKFGRLLGAAFQITDDVLGIWGDPTVTGKPIGTDLIHRKRSFPVVAALASKTPAGVQLSRVYAAERPIMQSEVQHLTALVEAAGGKQEAAQQIDALLCAAAAALPDHMPAAALRLLVELIPDRVR